MIDLWEQKNPHGSIPTDNTEKEKPMHMIHHMSLMNLHKIILKKNIL